MDALKTYSPDTKLVENLRITEAQYDAMYKGSIEQPDIFWAVQAKRLDWVKTPTKIKNTNFGDKANPDVSIKWYEDGILNACYNCIDRHVENGQGDKVAFIYEGDDPNTPPNTDDKITYAGLQTHVAKLANALKSKGVKKGDRVIIYMPMVPEAAYAMLACARIGAIHSVVFGGFSPQSLRERIIDCDAKIVITANEGYRGGKKVPLKTNVDAAITDTDINTVLVFQRTDTPTDMHDGRDIWWHDAVDAQSADCPCEPMNAEDPLFILYTSGSTGKPKGVLHTTGGYMVYASLTHEVSFDYREGEIYWCTADVGWVTGHSYIVYGPLANGATSLIFEGVPSYPDYSRFWQVVDKHKVNIFYTAPTAIRALLSKGDEYVKTTSRDSLRILGTVGEPINAEAWEWYYHTIGNAKCPVIDTWWQTETGGHMITPLPCHTLKPGKAQKPFFGVKPALVDNEGNLLDETNAEKNERGSIEGNFVLLDSWPGQMRTIYGDHDRFVQTYFTTFPGMYCTGDGARRDPDGDYRITGRVDDVINVSGHRMGTAEIEEAIDEHPCVAESAIVGFPHDIKGTGIYAYVILNKTATSKPDKDLETAINAILREEIGPIAKVDKFQFVADLPKTRSGKIMRRILRKIACGESDSLGDISTLADPSVVEDLIKNG